MSNPWLKFYPRDWRGDQALRAVSIAARGLWIEMLCVMHEASPYGHLVLGGRAVSNDVLARIAGLGTEECGALIAELESAGVLSRTRKGVIYSRRMLKDHSRSEKGRKSINRRWKQEAEYEQEIGQPNRSLDRSPITQKPEARSSEDKSSGGEPPPDPVKALFDVGVSLLKEAGHDERQARSLIGKWRKSRPDGEVLSALIDCRTRAISDPVEWLMKRFQGGDYVSASGFVYRGGPEEVMRQAEKRGDKQIYWLAASDLGKTRMTTNTNPGA